MSEEARAAAAGALPLFRLRDVRVSFGGREALSVGSLDVAAGQVTALLGENGSGKTTLLRVLNGLLAPASGSVEYRGSPLSADGFRPIRAGSVLVHQSPVLFRGTVYANVAYGLGVRGFPREETASRVAAALALAGLSGFERRRSSALSGGEKQRVSLARALALKTPVLFLDEPAANLDAENRRLVEGVVRRAAAAGATIVLSSHALEFAYRVSDRILRLEGGRVSAGTENVLRGRVGRRDEQFTYFTSGGCTLLCPAREGDFTVAVLPFEDVILSLAPLASSARNQLTGTVRSVAEEAGGTLRVTVDCGAPVQALITRAAAVELGIVPGRGCVVTFKASAVRLY